MSTSPLVSTPIAYIKVQLPSADGSRTISQFILGQTTNIKLSRKVDKSTDQVGFTFVDNTFDYSALNPNSKYGIAFQPGVIDNKFVVYLGYMGTNGAPIPTSLKMAFTGYLETDDIKIEPFSVIKNLTLMDLSKQFRFQVYDTLPHPLYGNQTLAYFDKNYNLKNPSADGKTWVCDGKMFSQGTADKIWGSTHIDPALYVDTTGGSSPASTPMANGSINIVNGIWTGTAYTFDYKNGIVTLNTAVPTTSVVSLAGNPTYMAPEVMIRKLLVEKASWSSNYINLQTSNVLLPRFMCQDQSIWSCINQIAALTNPRFTPWAIFVDVDGTVNFYESKIDGPYTSKYIDGQNTLAFQPAFSSKDLRTVVRADSTVVTASGDQPVTSISYNVKAVNKYALTEPLTIDKNLLMNVRNLSQWQAISYMNMLTASVLAQVGRPKFSAKLEVWPDPTASLANISDKVRVKSTKYGIDSDFLITGIEDDISSGSWKRILDIEEVYEPINYSLGIPGAVYPGAATAATVQPPSTALIGSVQLGSGKGNIFAYNLGDIVTDPMTDKQVMATWDASDGQPMNFNVFLNGMPASGQPQAPTQSSLFNYYSYFALPPGVTWSSATYGPTGKKVYYCTSPGGSVTGGGGVSWPTSGQTVMVGPDSIFYTFNHAYPPNATDLVVANVWSPNVNKNAAFGGSPGYTAQTTSTYVWTWWYLCLDSSVGSGQANRLVQRPNPTKDGVANSITASSGLWLNSQWSSPPGPGLHGEPASTFYGNLVAGVTDYTTPPPGFIGANVMGTSPAVNIGVAFGTATAPAGATYVGFRKKNRGHFCVFAMNSLGITQFVRVPFYLIV